MKKLLPILISITVMVMLMAPLTVSLAVNEPLKECKMSHDVGVTGCPVSGACVFETTPQCGLCCLLNSVYTVTDWLFYFVFALVMVFVILGGFFYLTAGGDPAKVTQGQGYLVYAAVGFAIALFARAIPALVKFILGAQ